MVKNKRIPYIIEALEREYPDAICSLDYVKPYELLISVRLAAQCTDLRVNIVTKDLFSRFPTLESIAAADVEEIANIVRPCGLGNTKARDIVATCKLLIDEYNSIVPDDLDELLKLPGVGRKTANLIVGDVYGKPAVVCDTHCIRITNLLGLTDSKNATIVEKQLRAILPLKKSNDFCHRMVLHGRAVCKARHPQCNECIVQEYCDYGSKRTLR